jgi:hypothetical protein
MNLRATELSGRKPGLLLLEAIDQTLADLLGRRARDAIYDHLERKRYMSRDEVPQRLGEFCDLLDANFGKGGRTIQRTIAKRLYSKLNKSFPDYPGCTLVEYVEMVNSQPSNGVPLTKATVTTHVFSETAKQH